MSRGRLAVLTVAGIVLTTTVSTLGWAWWELRTPFSGWEGERVVVDLPRGMDAGSMLIRLHEAGVVHRPGVLKAWLVARGEGERLRAGEGELVRLELRRGNERIAVELTLRRRV